MATVKAPVLRHVLGRQSCCQRYTQRRWAQVHDVRFLATHRPQDAVIEKYKEKLDRKAKECIKAPSSGPRSLHLPKLLQANLVISERVSPQSTR